MNKDGEGTILSNTDISKTLKRWFLLIVFINITMLLLVITILGSMQQLYGKIQRLNLSNNEIVQNISENFCINKVKNVK